ncbi:EAL domain-containing protein [Aliivibrio sifiae]|uniref:bifunctional diguanylate cyclase/phosphodiesterase n=1 Tax=Aliivibrio sifiae TaxID=566293 RepID=UPI003D10C5D0
MSCKQKISLKFAITIPFMFIFTLIITVALNEQSNSYNHMISHVSEKLLNSSSRSINLALFHLLEDPLSANINMRHTIEREALYLPEKQDSLKAYLKQHFNNELITLHQVDSIGFGNKDGSYIGLKKNLTDKPLFLYLSDPLIPNQLNVYKEEESNTTLLRSINNYDPRQRPWYIKSVTNPRALWSDIYSHIEDKQSSVLSAIAPVYNKNKKLEGVLTTDVMLRSFNIFLNKEAKEISGNISIVDASGMIWLHSNHNPNAPFHHSIDRLDSIKDPVTKETVRYINSVGFNHVLQEKIITLNIEGEKHFMIVKPFTGNIPIKAFIIASIPESVLLGELPEQRNQSIFIMIAISLAAFILAMYIIRRLIQPIIDTAKSAHALSEGNWDTPLPNHCGTEEVMTLTRSFKLMAHNLKRSFQELQDKVTYDTLTNLYSRVGLTEAISTSISPQSGLLSFSVNGFRDINDSVGHLSGDHLLVDIAQRLKTHYQDENIEVARIGGAEFSLFFYSIDNVEELTRYAKQLQSIFNTPIQSTSGKVVIQLSIGIVYQLDNLNTMHWLRSASLALAYAQQTNDNIALFQPYMAEASIKKTQLTTELAQAIKNNELIPYYQPLINFTTGKVQGAEALIRWQSPLHGLISPSRFIPLAEDNGMIISIGYTILKQACIDTANKIKTGEWPQNFIIHVNVSTEQLHHSNAYQRLLDVLNDSGLAPHNLSLEIIESRLLSNDPFIIELLKKIRTLGVHLAIDDFGTGYSSLSYLHTLPFDCLKIDRSFVEGLTHSNADNSIANAIVSIAKGFDVSIVAEGIETIEQANILQAMGCDIAQGFLYSKALPLDAWPDNLALFSAEKI